MLLRVLTRELPRYVTFLRGMDSELMDLAPVNETGIPGLSDNATIATQ